MFEDRVVLTIRAFIGGNTRWRTARAPEPRVGLHLAGEVVGKPDMLADDRGETLAAVGSQNEPQLQRTETPAGRARRSPIRFLRQHAVIQDAIATLAKIA
jgi:hypothetical protein